MQCVILAAGEGKRMRPLTAQRPKVMLPLANRPMVEHLICAARDAGITRFLLVVGYMEKEIRRHFGNGSAFGVDIEYVTQRHQKGTADALSAARGRVSGDFLLMNGDMVLESADIRGMKESRPPCMGVHGSGHPEDYGVVQMKGELVSGLQEKTPEPRGNLVNAGIYSFPPGIFEYIERIERSPRGEFELTDALAELISRKELRGYRLESWIDVGYPWDLLQANERMMAGIESRNDGKVEEGVVLNGPVNIGKGSIVRAGSYIEGPCVVGRDCRIGPHAYIRGSTAIGDGCHVGHATEVKNSIIFSGTKLPHFNYIGDSVVGSGCNFGAGTKVANLRHDHAIVTIQGIQTGRDKMGAIIGDNVRFGINCSVNVGAVVGSGAMIAPHTFVDGYIGTGTKIGYR